MAIKSYTTKNIGSSCVLVQWADLANGDEGEPVKLAGAADRSVQVEGVFSGATVAVVGSLDESNFEVLTDPQGNGLNFTAAKIEAVTEATVQAKPTVSGGDGSTLVTVSMLLRSAK